MLGCCWEPSPALIKGCQKGKQHQEAAEPSCPLRRVRQDLGLTAGLTGQHPHLQGHSKEQDTLRALTNRDTETAEATEKHSSCPVF